MSIIIVVVIYILIQMTVQGILGGSITQFRDAPLAETARRMIGPIGATIVIIGASFSMFGNLSGMILNMPRVLFVAARDRVIPSKGLAKVHQEFLTPHISIICYAFLGFYLPQLANLSNWQCSQALPIYLYIWVLYCLS